MTDNDPPTDYFPTARVSVCIGSKDWVGALPDEALLAEFELPESETVNLRREVEDLLAVERPAGVVLRETRSYTSWGADSGEVVRLVLFIASSGISGVIGNALYDFLRRLARREQMSGLTPVEARPITRDEAVERARWWLVSHYAIDVEGLDPVPQRDEDLEVVGEVEDRKSGGWKISFTDTIGATYHVEIGLLADLPSVVKVGREAGKR